MNNLYVVIMAGGSGERLWPLSRRHRPKQLLPFKNQQSLLEKTIERISPLVPVDRRIIVTTAEQAETIASLIGDSVGHIIAEPVARNTAPAFTLAASLIVQENPDAIIIFTHADHYIPQAEKYLEFLQHAVDSAAQAQHLVLLGLTPHYPATGYGYIAPAQHEIFPAAVEKFHEKPTVELATVYCKQGFLWNSGIVITQAAVFLETIASTDPTVLDAVYDYLEGSASYDQVPSISVDHAVLERADNCVVLPADFVWCDVGNLETFISLKDHTVQNNVINIDAKNNLVEVEDMLVALVGVDNMCVVQNENILLVVNRNQVEKVKLVLDVLKKEQNEEYV